MTFSIKGPGGGERPEFQRQEQPDRARGEQGPQKSGGHEKAGGGRKLLAQFEKFENSLDIFWKSTERGGGEDGCGRKRACDMSRAEKREAMSALKGLLHSVLNRLEKCGGQTEQTPPSCRGSKPPQGRRPEGPGCETPKPEVPRCGNGAAQPTPPTGNAPTPPKPEAPTPTPPKPDVPTPTPPKPDCPTPVPPKPEDPTPVPPKPEDPTPVPPKPEDPTPVPPKPEDPCPTPPKPEDPTPVPPKPEDPTPVPPKPEDPTPVPPKPEDPTPVPPKPEDPTPVPPKPEDPTPVPPKPEDPTPVPPKPEDPTPVPPKPEDPTPVPPKPEDPTPVPPTGNDPTPPPPTGNNPKPTPPKPEDPTPVPPTGNDPTPVPPTGNDPKPTPPAPGKPSAPDVDAPGAPTTGDGTETPVPIGPSPAQNEIIAAQTILHADPDNAAAIAVLSAAYYSAEGVEARAALDAAEPAAIGADPTAGASLGQQTLATLIDAPFGTAGEMRVNGAPIAAGQLLQSGDVVTAGDITLTLSEAQAYEVNVRVATAEAGHEIGAAQQAHYENAVAAGRAAYDAALTAGAGEAGAANAWVEAVAAFEAENPEPWRFPTLDENGQANTLAGLSADSYNPPQIVQSADGPMQVFSENAFFQEVSVNGGMHRLDQIAGTPADALRDLFENPGQYELDCATGANAVLLKGVLETVGDETFNTLFADGLDLSGWNMDRGPVYADHVTMSQDGLASLPTVYGPMKSVAGDVAPYDARRDDLRIGENVYFEVPGDNSSFLQGWNAIYLGVDPANGEHLFFSQGAGVMTVQLDAVTGADGGTYVTPTVTSQNGVPAAGGGAVGGTYLATGSVSATHAMLARQLAAA